MRHNLIGEMRTVFTNMNEDERRAYSLGISHAYADVFTVLMQAERADLELIDARVRIHDQWTEIVDIQTKLGVL